MTIRQAITTLDSSCRNTVEEPVKRAWLSKLDGQLHQDVVLTHVHETAQAEFCGYDAQTDCDTVLLIPAPYDAEVYPLYLQMLLDRENGEGEKYNQSAALYNQALLAFFDWYNRKHLPLHGGRRFVF